MQGQSKHRSLELPETVVEDILSKLPVKSLFITRHHQNNLKNNHLNLLLKSSLAIDDVDYFSALSTEKGDNFLVKENIDFLDFHTGWFTSVVYGPCNGLFCLSYDGEVALWNPSTREFKFLPQSSLQSHPSVLFTASGCLGFGFDFKTDDYKVVRFVTYNIVHNEEECMPNESIPKVELYSIKSDSWKEISDPGTKPFCTPLFNSYINGLYYWKVAGNSDCFVLSFDMAKEEFSTFPSPKFGGSLDQYDLQLLNFNGSLGAIVYPKKGIENSFDLWVMMSGSWTRKFSIQSIGLRGH